MSMFREVENRDLPCHLFGYIIDAEENTPFLDTMDICSIFGNAIDNAIEYEHRIEDSDCRLIKITIRTQNRFLLIRIENYCPETIWISNGVIATSKTDKQMHGYGIISIRKAVEKYEGSLTLDQDGEWFVLTALIPVPG